MTLNQFKCELPRTELVATGRSATVMACSWPFKFIVYKLTGITFFHVVGTNSSSGNVGHSGPEGSRFEPGHVKISFFKGHGRHVHFFLLLPNDTGAPCLGGIHIVHSLHR